MAKAKEPINPFYVVVVMVGIVFVITAFAYGTMAYRAIAPGAEAETHGLMTLLDQYGMRILGVELGLLGLATVGAMWFDGRRS